MARDQFGDKTVAEDTAADERRKRERLIELRQRALDLAERLAPAAGETTNATIARANAFTDFMLTGKVPQ